MKRFRLFFCLMSVMAMLFATSESGWAQPALDVNFTAHWMSKLPDETRLCDLSIPCAHDAATWELWEDLGKCQEFDERTLFSYGVRAFDLRLGPKGKYRHGPKSVLNYDCNTYLKEQNDHMPTKEQLKGEFMIWYIGYEPEDKSKQYTALNQWAKDVLENSSNHYTLDDFVHLEPGMTLGDVRGKILVIGAREYCTDYLEAGYRIPIVFIDGHTFDGYLDSSLRIDIDSDDKAKKYKYPRYTFRPGAEFSVRLQAKKKDVKRVYDTWFNYYDNNDKNEEGQLCEVLLNSHYVGIPYENPGDIAADDDSDVTDPEDGDMGVNHFTYQYLNKQTIKRPLGIVQFDFIGEKEHDLDPCYGDKLLESVVLNNFMCGLTDAKYISDIVVLKGDSKKAVEASLVQQGYINFKCYTHHEGSSGVPSSYVGIGYKMTNDIDEAISDIIVCRTSFAPSSVIEGPDGHIYHLVTSLTSNWDGDIEPYNVDGTKLYLYYTKDCKDDATTKYALTKMDISNVAPEEGFKNVSVWTGFGSMDAEVADLFWNMKSVADYSPAYLQIACHSHEFSDFFTDEEHYKLCPTCGKVINKASHTLALRPVDACHHEYGCVKCKYVKRVRCKSSEYDADGFGMCTDCRGFCAMPAEIVSGSYVISNPGQLYWFAALVNNGENNSAVLADDITLTPEIQVKQTWVPIGTYRDEEGKVIMDYSRGYRGTFDGAGHTISGIQYAGGEIYPAHGLFGQVNGGAIRNLGVINSSFSGYEYVGSVAGYLKNACVENVFSTAEVKKEGIGPDRGGIAGSIFVTKMSNVFSCGSVYYQGKLDHKAIGPVYGGSVLENVYTQYSDDGNKNELTVLSEEAYKNGDLLKLLNDNVGAHNSAVDGGEPWGYWQQEISTDDVPHFELADLDYLCLTASEDETTIRLKTVNLGEWPAMQCSSDGIAWIDYRHFRQITLNEGDKVYFRAKGINASFSKSTGYVHFTSDKKVAASGSVMALINGFRNETTVPDNAFVGLFENCSNLTSAPELPATTLGEFCYMGMFKNCTGLTEAPVLPATELKSGCYSHMFDGCSNLSKMTVGFTTWDVSKATSGWVSGVAETGTFVCPKGLAQKTGDGFIPTGWIVERSTSGDDTPTAIEATFDRAGNRDGKYLEDGRIVIVKNGVKYDVVGRRVK